MRGDERRIALAAAASLAILRAAVSGCGRSAAVCPEVPGSSGPMPEWCGPCAEAFYRAPEGGERRYVCRDCDIVIRADPKAPPPPTGPPFGVWH